MPDSFWKTAAGDFLFTLHLDGDIRSEIPQCEALYLWKRNFRPEGYELHSEAAFIQWLNRILTCPYGETRSVRLTHFLEVGSIKLSGPKLDSDKQRLLHAFIQSPKNRRWLMRYLEAVAVHSPALYVGETGNLQNRVTQHLRAQTDFGTYVDGAEELGWRDLDLHYCRVGDPTESSSESRKTLEYLTSVLTIAGYTKRPG